MEVEFRDLVELYDIRVIYIIQYSHKKNDHQEAKGRRYFQMSSSSFLYDWENFSNVIRKIYELINVNEFGCDIYIMEYITQILTHCSKGNLDCVHQCIKFHKKQTNGLIFETKCSSIKQRYMKFGDGSLSAHEDRKSVVSTKGEPP